MELLENFPMQILRVYSYIAKSQIQHAEVHSQTDLWLILYMTDKAVYATYPREYFIINSEESTIHDPPSLPPCVVQ